jgi:hypothetical protein
MRHPFEHQLQYYNEKQDYKIGIVCGRVLMGGVRVSEGRLR